MYTHVVMVDIIKEKFKWNECAERKNYFNLYNGCYRNSKKFLIYVK